MLPSYQLKTSGFYNISIGNVKKLVPNLFNKEKYVLHYKNLQLYLRLELKLKKYTLYQSLINHSGQNHMLNSRHKSNRNKRNGNQNGKVLYRLTGNFTYGKAMENLRKRIDVRLSNITKTA